jgi:hypothetical protein
MRWKDVFLIWFCADLLIGAGTAIAAFFTSGMATDEFGLILVVGIYGLLVTLPSLGIMCIFHAAFIYNNKLRQNYLVHYSLLIISINIAYWLIAVYLGRFYMDDMVTAFFLYTTFSGVLALLLVNHRIKKRISNTAIEQEIT